MEQHAIPQNVSSYQFKLVGDMTLKQFFQLAGGLLAALFFYSIPVIGIIKWPFVIMSALLGVGLAFLPLEERPLERWIFAFFRAIYAPTEFYWKKTVAPVKYFQDEPQTAQTPATPQQAALNGYLSVPNQSTGSSAKLEGQELGFLSRLTGLFAGMVGQKSAVAPVNTNVVPVGTTPLPATTPLAPVATPAPAKPAVSIPQSEAVKVIGTSNQHIVVEEKKPEPIYSSPQITTNQVAPIIAGEEFISTKQAMFSVDAAPPNPPTIPNVVVGQVVDADRKIVEGAIMEIKDSAGRPVRALRSNKVGHFVTITPLENGTYEIITEKEGYTFQTVNFEAQGALIPPILVSGSRAMETVSAPVTQQLNNQPRMQSAQQLQ